MTMLDLEFSLCLFNFTLSDILSHGFFYTVYMNTVASDTREMGDRQHIQFLACMYLLFLSIIRLNIYYEVEFL